jgi:formylmethanofuran dehydrogenase subunit B
MGRCERRWFEVHVVSGVTCPFCGCCCDDVEVIVEDNKVFDVRNACALGDST